MKNGPARAPATLPNIPSIPDIPDAADLSDVPDRNGRRPSGDIPLLPDLPQLPDSQSLPDMPQLPNLPEGFLDDADSFDEDEEDWQALKNVAEDQGLSSSQQVQEDYGSRPARRKRKDDPLDYLSVRLQSPDDIRQAAIGKDTNDEMVLGRILHDREFDEAGKAVPNGLFCENCFGEARTRGRRERFGVAQLAWPCGHVWFTGKLGLGRAAALIGKKPSHFFEVRSFEKDLYLGDWAAVALWPLRMDDTGTLQVPAVGSPVAAALVPALNSLKIDLTEARSREIKDSLEARWSSEPLVVDKDVPKLSRDVRLLASVAQATCSRNLPTGAERLSRTARRALSLAAGYPEDLVKAMSRVLRIGAELPSMALELSNLLRVAEAGGSDVGLPLDQRQTDDKIGAATSCLIANVVELLQEEEPELSSDTITELLSLGMTDADDGLKSAAHPLRRAARKDPYKLWSALVLPGFSGDLAEKLEELQKDMDGQVESYDFASVKPIIQRLRTRAEAALDIVLRAFTCEPEESAGSQPSTSRYRPEQREVFWYDPSMPSVAFHTQDVDRVRSLPSFKREKHGSFKVKSEHSELRHIEREANVKKARGLSTPSKKQFLGAEAAYYRRGQDAEKRWHVPLQDATRQGCAGGLRPLKRGEDIPERVGQQLAVFHATRPRPAGIPAPVPLNMEVEGALLIGSGAAALRQVLCDVEPMSMVQILTENGNLLDGLLRTRRTFDLGARHGVSMYGFSSKQVSNLLVSARDEMRGRTMMMEAAAFKQQLPECGVFTDLPIIPPDLRTTSLIDRQEDGGFADDLNSLYRAILKANAMLLRNFKSGANPRLLRYSKMRLQTAVDNVIDNGRVGPGLSKSNGELLESVAGRLKGKHGRMRSNMLGKRVDYSARTVIVVEPKLELGQCGLPFSIARVMFEDFLIYELRSHEDATAYMEENGRSLLFEEVSEWKQESNLARDLLKWFDKQAEDVQWELLTKAIGDRRIMLNRAPTLHRLSVQAFQPHLTTGEALKIHPLVCSPFNADFDGDTMTMHLALGDEAQQELEELMTPTRNLSSPADGEPVIGPTQDMVLGIYYLTSDPPDPDAPAEALLTEEEVTNAAALCAAGELSHHAAFLISRELLIEMAPEAGEDDPFLNLSMTEDQEAGKDIRTTAGRLLFFLMLHLGFTPDMCLHQDLLDDLDSAPLAVQES